MIPLRLVLSSFLLRAQMPKYDSVESDAFKTKPQRKYRAGERESASAGERERERAFSFTLYYQTVYEIFDWINSIDLIKLHGKNSNAVKLCATRMFFITFLSCATAPHPLHRCFVVFCSALYVMVCLVIS